MIDESCGIPVPITTYDETVSEISVAINKLASNEGLRQKLATGAYTRDESYSWEKKVEVLNEIYRNKLS